MKVEIRIRHVDTGWEVELTTTPGSLLLPALKRTLVRGDGLRDGFPVPPTTELQDLPQAVQDLLCAQDDSLQQHFVNCLGGQPAQGQVAAFGAYLSGVLLGPHNLKALDPIAPSLQLDLWLPENAPEISRLPWEMMFGTDGFPLVGEKVRDVAITRGLDAPRHPVDLEPLERPLRILFVVGRRLDEQLRPGAEYIGLLRQMKIPVGQASMTYELHTRLVTEATRESLGSAVEEFQPHVVHFICHGGPDGTLLLTNVQPGVDSDRIDRCNGSVLLDLLQNKKTRRLPPVVVLNACHSADLPGNSPVRTVYQSLAASLVAGGVAAGVGMAGEVADGACRLFTYRFYRALLNGEPIALAAAQGRRAALVHFNDAQENVEWARPIVFCQSGADALLQLSPATKEQEQFMAIPGKFRITLQMRLCDRLQALQEWEIFRAHALLAASTTRALALAVEEDEGMDEERGVHKKFGKSCLLEEIAARSVLDGFVPCVLPSSSAADPAPTLLGFALAMAEAADVTRQRFLLPPRELSAAVKKAYEIFNEPIPAEPTTDSEADALLRKAEDFVTRVGAGKEKADIEIKELRNVLGEDLQRLLGDVSARFPRMRQPLVLIDDLHRYEGVVQPLLEKLMSELGFGRILRNGEPLVVPVVFSYSAVTNVSSHCSEVINGFLTKRSGYVRKLPIKRISEGQEERLAYCQYLLYRTNNPLAFSTQRNKRQDVENLLEVIKDEVKGIPSFLPIGAASPGLLNLARRQRTLIEADDDKIFQSLS